MKNLLGKMMWSVVKLLKVDSTLYIQNISRQFGVDPFYSRSILKFYAPSENFIQQLCDKYGSDKGSILPNSDKYPWPPHNYSDLYLSLFWGNRQEVRVVFECGIGTNNILLPSNMSKNGTPGASLRVWRDFFPNAQIYGGDIDDTILFTEERIKTFRLDQTKITSIEEFLSHVEEEEIDVIIDDGLHEFSAAISLFENVILRLANGGIYVIEDVLQRDIAKFSNYFNAKNYQVEFIAMYRALLNLDDNFLIVVRKPLL